MKLIEELTKLGIVITDDQKSKITSKFTEEVISVDESNKKIKKVEDERDQFKTDYEDAKATLEGFEGKDFSAIEKERDEWKKRAEDSEKDFKKQMAQRDYNDLVEKAVSELRFTSNAAKKAFIADLNADPLKVKNGELLGFDDFVRAYKKEDSSAFVDEQQEQAKGNAAKFTDSTKKGGSNGGTMTKEDILKIADRTERQAAMAEHIDLFQ